MRQRLTLLMAFGVFGLLFGIWQVVLPDLRLALGIGDAALGLALTVGAAASLPAMWAAGRLVDHWGARPVVTVAALAMAACYVAFASIPSYPLLIVLLLVLFGASGAYDIAVNAAAVAHERATARNFMTTLHAAFSAGALVGALGAGGLLSLGAPFNLLYLIVPPALATTVALAARSGLAGTAPALGTGGAAPALRSRLLVALGIVAAMATLSEGALESWSAIYLRLTLGFPPALGVAGVAAFHAAMLIGRLGAGAVVARAGGRGTLVAAGTLALAAMPLALATESAAVVLTGLFLVAIGLSAVFPIAVSLAGAAGGGSGRAAASVMTIGYAGFLVGPAMIGGIAAVTSLRAALLVVAVAGAVTVLLAARALGRPSA